MSDKQKDHLNGGEPFDPAFAEMHSVHALCNETDREYIEMCIRSIANFTIRKLALCHDGVITQDQLTNYLNAIARADIYAMLTGHWRCVYDYITEENNRWYSAMNPCVDYFYSVNVPPSFKEPVPYISYQNALALARDEGKVLAFVA